MHAAGSLRRFSERNFSAPVKFGHLRLNLHCNPLVIGFLIFGRVHNLRIHWPFIEHSARTAVAAMVSLWVARHLGLPEAYWAPVTTLIVMQSTFGQALLVSGRRLAGTALGVIAGALLANRFGDNLIAFGVGVFFLGVICSFLRLERNAYRYAGIATAIVMLVTRDTSRWVLALHRFIEVSAGILVGLAMTAVWPERIRAAGQTGDVR